MYSKDIINISYSKYIPREIRSFKLILDDNINYTYKYLNKSELNKLFLQKEECDDIIIIRNRLLTDTSIANIAVYYNNR